MSRRRQQIATAEDILKAYEAVATHAYETNGAFDRSYRFFFMCGRCCQSRLNTPSFTSIAAGYRELCETLNVECDEEVADRLEAAGRQEVEQPRQARKRKERTEVSPRGSEEDDCDTNGDGDGAVSDEEEYLPVDVPLKAPVPFITTSAPVPVATTPAQETTSPANPSVSVSAPSVEPVIPSPIEPVKPVEPVIPSVKRLSVEREAAIVGEAYKSYTNPKFNRRRAVVSVTKPNGPNGGVLFFIKGDGYSIGADNDTLWVETDGGEWAEMTEQTLIRGGVLPDHANEFIERLTVAARSLPK